MDEESRSDAAEMASGTDSEIRQLLGIFDTPAYARRGQELEHRINGLQSHCRRQRSMLLEPSHMRLRQWAKVALGFEDHIDFFDESLMDVWNACEAPPPRWATTRGSWWARRGTARDLVNSLQRFNERWSRFLIHVDLKPLNHTIDQYNKYYVFEKECSIGSTRLAARHFQPCSPWTAETLCERFPTINVPSLKNQRLFKI